jgi:hypothetical protein
VDHKVHVLQLLILLLPQEHIQTLIYLFQFLKRVSLLSDKNSMQASNLGTVFGPTLMWQSNDTAWNEVTVCGDLLTFLISHVHEFPFLETPASQFLFSLSEQQKRKRETHTRQRSSTVGSVGSQPVLDKKNKYKLTSELLPELQMGTPASEGSLLRHVMKVSVFDLATH